LLPHRFLTPRYHAPRPIHSFPTRRSSDLAVITGVPAETIRDLARQMAATRTMLTASWSLQRADHGEQPYWALVLLAAVGALQRPDRKSTRLNSSHRTIS